VETDPARTCELLVGLPGNRQAAEAEACAAPPSAEGLPAAVAQQAADRHRLWQDTAGQRADLATKQIADRSCARLEHLSEHAVTEHLAFDAGPQGPQLVRSGSFTDVAGVDPDDTRLGLDLRLERAVWPEGDVPAAADVAGETIGPTPDRPLQLHVRAFRCPSETEEATLPFCWAHGKGSLCAHEVAGSMAVVFVGRLSSRSTARARTWAHVRSPRSAARGALLCSPQHPGDCASDEEFCVLA
jgi:hypothetical protein